jgi:hypothetical protein
MLKKPSVRTWLLGVMLGVACLVGLIATAAARNEVHPSNAAAKRPRGHASVVQFPTPSDTGVPAHWRPAQVRNRDMVVTRPGALVHDILFRNSDLVIKAPHVTVKRIEMQGGLINNSEGARCQNGLVVEDSTFAPPPGRQFWNNSQGVTGVGGFTARRVKVWRLEEGFRDGGKSGGCGPTRVEDSFAKLSIPPGCPGDPHSDGIQGYDGAPLTVDNVTIDFTEASCGTAPFFDPDQQGNTTANVNRLLVMGGGIDFRDGVPGSVRSLKIVNHSWYYAPIDVRCGLLSHWDAQIVTINANYQITRTVRSQPCK